MKKQNTIHSNRMCHFRSSLCGLFFLLLFSSWLIKNNKKKHWFVFGYALLSIRWILKLVGIGLNLVRYQNQCEQQRAVSFHTKFMRPLIINQDLEHIHTHKKKTNIEALQLDFVLNKKQKIRVTTSCCQLDFKSLSLN